ncbi:MAG: hypothetical protein IPM74_03325 [Crocinitomicaceae bacterium]|nr:hypothetical protein [Crocinitomicaceae bacterium]
MRLDEYLMDLGLEKDACLSVIRIYLFQPCRQAGNQRPRAQKSENPKKQKSPSFERLDFTGDPVWIRTKDLPDEKSGCSIRFDKKKSEIALTLLCDPVWIRTKDLPDLKSGCSILTIFYRVIPSKKRARLLSLYFVIPFGFEPKTFPTKSRDALSASTKKKSKIALTLFCVIPFGFEPKTFPTKSRDALSASTKKKSKIALTLFCVIPFGFEPKTFPTKSRDALSASTKKKSKIALTLSCDPVWIRTKDLPDEKSGCSIRFDKKKEQDCSHSFV